MDFMAGVNRERPCVPCVDDNHYAQMLLACFPREHHSEFCTYRQTTLKLTMLNIRKQCKHLIGKDILYRRKSNLR